MLSSWYTEGIGVGMANQVEVVTVQTLHGRQESAALLPRTSKGYGSIWKVRNCGTSRRAVPGEVPMPRSLLENRVTGAVTQAIRSWWKLVGKVRLWKRSQGGKDGFSDKMSFGLQESQDPGILGVFGLHSLYSGEVVN